MLSRVLNVDQAGLTSNVINELIERGESESHWLEFKSELPRKDEDGYREFARDVSAFANADGGIIIFGVKEQDDRASTATPVALGRDTTRLQQVLASLILPRIQGLSWHPVPGATPDSGFLVVEIEASPLKPHLVSYGESFSCWRRSGRQRHSVSEADLERAYRDRWQGVNDARSDLEALEQRAQMEGRGGCFWAATVPYGLGRRIAFPVQGAREKMREIATSERAQGFYRQHVEADVRLRFRRVETAYDWDGRTNPNVGTTVLTDRGEMLRMWSLPQWSDPLGTANLAGVPFKYLTASMLVDAVVTALVRFRELARGFSISGSVIMRAGLVLEPGPVRLLGLAPYPEVIGQSSESVVTETQFDCEDLFTPRPLMLTARQLHSDLMTVFGDWRECPITQDGSLNLTLIVRDLQPHARNWAAANGVSISG